MAWLEAIDTELIVFVASVATSTMSALAGLGGGVILLAVLAQLLPTSQVIPIHGAIQLVSNGTRALALRRQIVWRVIGWWCVAIVPASIAGWLTASALPESALRLALGLFVLTVSLRTPLVPPSWRVEHPASLAGLGALSGYLNTTVGVSGPVTSPFLASVTASHRAFVATAAATQVVGHVLKIGVYSLGEFSLADAAPVIIVGAVGVTIGTALGTRLMGRIPEARLQLAFRIVLFTLALRTIWSAIAT